LRDADGPAFGAFHGHFKFIPRRHPTNILSLSDTPSPCFPALSKLPSAKSASFRCERLSSGDG
jgi:hypothetical protein